MKFGGDGLKWGWGWNEVGGGGVWHEGVERGSGVCVFWHEGEAGGFGLIGGMKFWCGGLEWGSGVRG